MMDDLFLIDQIIPSWKSDEYWQYFSRFDDIFHSESTFFLSQFIFEFILDMLFFFRWKKMFLFFLSFIFLLVNMHAVLAHIERALFTIIELFKIQGAEWTFFFHFKLSKFDWMLIITSIELDGFALKAKEYTAFETK